jgi:hypothetical protein
MWHLLDGRLWTLDRRFRHGLQDHTSPCFVYLQEEDNATHILLQCVTTREVWHICRERFDLDIEESNHQSILQEWWTSERNKQRGSAKRVFDTLVCTITYALWKNRNAWLFEDERRQHGPLRIAALVPEEYNMLKLAHRENVRDQNDIARE